MQRPLERIAYDGRRDTPVPHGGVPRGDVVSAEGEHPYPKASEVFGEITLTLAVFLAIAEAVNLLLPLLGV